jgi:hypothetical protein
MNSGLSERLEQVRLEIGNQADYLQLLIDEFDVPYDVGCAMQVTVQDIRGIVHRIRELTGELPKLEPRRRKKAVAKRKRKG